jgi:putative Holliday junction resolvase
MAIDHGAKRIGLAVGDTETNLAAPVLGVPGSGSPQQDARAVLAASREYGADEFVLGLPLNMDDSEGPQARIVRGFGNALEQLSGLPVHYWDERLSSETAREKMIPAELTRKKRKARLDGIAAQAILQEFLDSPNGDSHLFKSPGNR